MGLITIRFPKWESVSIWEYNKNNNHKKTGIKKYPYWIPIGISEIGLQKTKINQTK